MRQHFIRKNIIEQIISLKRNFGQKEEKHKDHFRLEILPAYSPELNPTEKTWGFVKTKKLNASTATDRRESSSNDPEYYAKLEEG